MPCPVIAQDEVPWLSFSRLSLSAATSYHFSPWKKYNESLQLAQDAIRYSAGYPSPSGSLEKILGDGTFEIALGYRIISGLSVNLIGGYTSTSSNGAFSYPIEGIVYLDGYGYAYDSELSIHQDIKFNVLEYGIGFQYSYEIMEDVQLSTLASIHRSFGRFNFEYDYQAPYDRNLFSAELQETQRDFRAGIGALVRLYGPLSLSSSVEYRWLKFPNLRGNGTHLEQHNHPNNIYEQSREFNAGLGEADGYFGLEIDDNDKWYVAEYLLYRLWTSAEVQSWWKRKTPATLNLSGVGIKVGVRFEF